MAWWYYLVGVFAALFVVNAVPHLLHGLTGRQFPTPFVGGPPNLDTPQRNILWGAANLIVGAVLVWIVRDGLGEWTLLVAMAAAAVVGAAILVRVFGRGGA